MKTDTTTTMEIPVDEFNSMAADAMFSGRADVQIEYVIREVDGDPLDRFPGVDKVVAIRVKFKGTP